VPTGDVLAVDSVEEYPVHPFAPIYHSFTPGSSFKVITMTCALAERAVTPDKKIHVGNGEYRIVYPDGRPSGRVIHEAENAPTGSLSASECLAFSVNSGMAQIGIRVSDDAFHGYLVKLGYGRKPGTGLGSERAGSLPKLPWSYAYTHASVSFGHEISTTLWQHAAGLATIVRGGVYRPLRIVSGVEQSGRRWEVPLDEGVRVFEQRVCEQVRDMMRLGAEIGTGDDIRLALEKVAQEAGWPAQGGLDVATKTGTAQKVPAELCVHVEMPERRRLTEAGLTLTTERYRALRSAPKPHRNCYTSSVCVVGSLPGRDTELMVFVVAEEPRGKERFGSKVAGPTAAAILAEGLALTRNGETARREVLDGFFESTEVVRNPFEEPWRSEESWRDVR
jgi:cell division protein FtsI/penicillin-binding protein 2